MKLAISVTAIKANATNETGVWKSKKNRAGGELSLNIKDLASICDIKTHLNGVIARYQLAFTTFTNGH